MLFKYPFSLLALFLFFFFFFLFLIDELGWFSIRLGCFGYVGLNKSFPFLHSFHLLIIKLKRRYKLLEKCENP